MSVALAVLGCGADNSETQIDNPERAGAETNPQEDHGPKDESQREVPVHKGPEVLAGQFEATPGNGYTLDVAYELPLKAEVDIANALPGEAIVLLTFNGKLTFTNTTPGQNLGFNADDLPIVNLYWPRSQLPPSAQCPEDESILIRRAQSCWLAAFRGEFDPQVQEGIVELGPNSSTGMTLDSRLLNPGTTVDEKDADAVSSLIDSTTPSVVTFLIDGLEPSCTVGESVLSGVTAVLTGSGQTLADGGTDERGELPLCSDI